MGTRCPWIESHSFYQSGGRASTRTREGIYISGLIYVMPMAILRMTIIGSQKRVDHPKISNTELPEPGKLSF